MNDGAIDNYSNIYNEFINLALNRFEWDNLPYGLTSEQLELMLIEHGLLMFFSDRNNGHLLLPCYGTTDLNVYGLPQLYRVNALNGKYNVDVKLDDGVLIKNNNLGSPDLEKIRVYAQRINDIEMTQEVNLFQQNIPKIVMSDENSKLSAKALIDKIKKFKFAIFAKSTLGTNIQTSDVLDTSVEMKLLELQEYKNKIRNELLTFLGINNNENSDKKERLIVDEVNSNNEYTQSNLDLAYDMRKKACEEINMKLGGNIKVKKREVEKSGAIHDTTKKDN